MKYALDHLVILALPEESTQSVITRMAMGGVKYFGICLVVDTNQRLLGVFNNGDVLRLMARGANTHVSIGEAMVTNPIVVREELTDAQVITLVRQQVRQRNPKKHKELTQYVPVVDQTGVVVDVLDIYDLLARMPHLGERVAIYGMGFVGLTLAAALASRGHTVTGVDTNAPLIQALEQGQPHVLEPRLPDLIRQGKANGSLTFTIRPQDEHHRVVIIAVGTPIDDQDQASMAALEAVCAAVGPRLRRGDLVLLRSTVPVGTTRSLVIPQLEQASGLVVGKGFHVAFTPERTVEGRAIQELSSLPQVVGGATDKCVDMASVFWSTLTDSIVRVDSLEAAELVKLINNSYRDLSFAFANGLALLADQYNLDANRLIQAANEGYPRNPIPRPSPGVGGYCLTKDPFLYAAMGDGMGHGTLAKVGRQINSDAALYPVSIVERYAHRRHQKVAELRVLVVGMAFKGLPETNDLRGSTAVEVAHKLMALGAEVTCWDAVVGADQLSSWGLQPANNLAAAGKADVFLILNNHPDNVPEDLLSQLSNRPVLFFDGWHLLERHQVEKYPHMTYATLGYMTPQSHSSLTS
jgi:UDP-N-acetyl-D-mannosaminuronic acid dehydrogenase